MFKQFGDFIYKAPWWALILMGVCTLLLLGLFATPFNVIRLSDSGTTKEARRAIQREINSAFFSSALGVAEGVVSEMRQRTNDPARREDLDRALRELADARVELDREVASVVNDHQVPDREVAGAAREAARAVAEAAREAAHAAVDAAREAAREKVALLKEARNEAREAQKKAGIDDAAGLVAFDQAIRAAKDSEQAADEALVKLMKMRSEVDANQDGKAAATDATERATISADGKVKKGPTSGEAIISITPPSPPTQPLPPETRQQIRDKVSRDFRRIGIGSMMILLFIPLFVMLLVAKVFIGRSRRAVDFAEVKKREAESANVNRQIVEAKLQALQAQVEPHFLYNTLANVQALTEIDPPQANKMTGHLINYLRAALPKMRESTSTIGQEVLLVSAYLSILKMRMGERLAFEIETPKELEGMPFPPLMLPSLVENAIKHGLEPQRDGGRIDVLVWRDGDRLHVAVRDTGRGLTDAPIQSGDGVGLSNVRERLQALFGDAAKLTLESNQPKGVIATIEVPASGVGTFSSAPKPPPPVPPSGFWPRLRAASSKTHSLWSRTMAWVLVALLAALLIAFVAAVIGMASGGTPFSIGDTRLGGVEGMAIGTAFLVVVFAVLALVAVILVALLYGLGFLFIGLLIVIPIIILVSMIPALAPFVAVGFLLYWFWWRKRRSVRDRPHDR